LVVVGALTSLAWALFLQDRDPNRAYYGTDARAYQLLAGASLALAPGLIERLARVGRSAQYLAGVSLAGLVILGSSLIPLGVIERGLCVTVTAALLLASVESAAGGLVKRVLSSSPFVFLGKISYATYLWHWPVIIVMVKLLAAGPVATAAIATLVATSIASLSFQLCERPIRESRLLDGHRHLVIGTGLAVSVVSALLFIPAIVTPGATSASAQGNQTAGFSPIPPGLDFAHAGFVSLPKPPECLGKDPEECTIVHGTGPHVLLMGDSHAQMMLPTFTEVAHRENLTFSAAISGGCPWQRNLYTGIGTNTCVPLKEDFYTRVIPALNPDVIVLMNFGYDDLSVTPFPVFGTNRIRVNRGNVTFDTLLAQTTIQSLAELRAEGRKLVIIEPIPRAASEPTQCLRTSKVLEACRYVANTKPSVVEQLYRMLAKQDDHVLSVDIDRLVCPYLPICDPVIGGHIVKIDAHHLTAEYARYLADDVDAYLKANGVLAR
jgi:hypothetical protein